MEKSDAENERKPESLDFEESNFSSYTACRNVIDFEIPENLPWESIELRCKSSQCARLSVSQMLKEILECQKRWMSLKNTLDENVVSEAKRDMLKSFIHHVNVEEEVGTQEREQTEKILDEQQQSQDFKKLKRTFSKGEQETKNIYTAYLQLEEFSKKELKADKSLVCLMELCSCVTGIHQVLMKDVLSGCKTPGGKFSTSERFTDYRGERHVYPKYESQQEWETIVNGLLDNYNALIEEIKKEIHRKKGESRTEGFLDLFKLAGWFLYKLVSLHPFSDGNGRLCRLLASYIIGLVSPFPSPIYNVYSVTQKSDYLDAIYNCRKAGDEKPGHLTLIMLESNWAAWKSFLQKFDKPVANITAER